MCAKKSSDGSRTRNLLVNRQELQPLGHESYLFTRLIYTFMNVEYEFNSVAQ